MKLRLTSLNHNMAPVRNNLRRLPRGSTRGNRSLDGRAAGRASSSASSSSGSASAIVPPGPPDAIKLIYRLLRNPFPPPPNCYTAATTAPPPPPLLKALGEGGWGSGLIESTVQLMRPPPREMSPTVPRARPFPPRFVSER